MYYLNFLSNNFINVPAAEGVGALNWPQKFLTFKSQHIFLIQGGLRGIVSLTFFASLKASLKNSDTSRKKAKILQGLKGTAQRIHIINTALTAREKKTENMI